MSDQPADSLPKGIQLTPFDPQFRDHPYEVLQSLRERAPVLRDDMFNRWYLTRFDDVRQILRDKDMSSDPRKANPESYIAKITSLAGTTPTNSTAVSMLFMDDPDHRPGAEVRDRRARPHAAG